MCVHENWAQPRNLLLNSYASLVRNECVSKCMHHVLQCRPPALNAGRYGRLLCMAQRMLPAAGRAPHGVTDLTNILGPDGHVWGLCLVTLPALVLGYAAGTVLPRQHRCAVCGSAYAAVPLSRLSSLAAVSSATEMAPS